MKILYIIKYIVHVYSIIICVTEIAALGRTTSLGLYSTDKITILLHDSNDPPVANTNNISTVFYYIHIFL